MNGQIPVRHMPHDDGLIDRGFRDGAASNCVERAAGVSAVPELQPGDAGNESHLPPPEPQEGDASRPPMPEPQEGEPRPQPGDAGDGSEEDARIPFNDHFTVIQEGLSGAFSRINERLQTLAASEKYQNSGAAEAFDLLHKLYSLINDQMMEQLRNMDKMTRDAMMNMLVIEDPHEGGKLK